MTTQENLELQIKTYDSNYRAGTPLVTDEVYDKLVEELYSKFPESTLLKKGVITEEKSIRKQKLPMPMFSLNKCKSITEVKEWLNKIEVRDDVKVVLTPKYDGISLLVNERSKQAWTRGDGEFGQESKFHFEKLNRDSDEEIECFFSIGEAIMPRKNFEKYKTLFANPRNMVAGLFNRDITTPELRDVDYIRYGMSMETDKSYQLHILNTLNKVQVPFRTVKAMDISETLIEDLYTMWSMEYKIDGIVIDIDDVDIRQYLGREENMNPAYARAIKFPKWSENSVVRVTGLTWQVSKQGKLKPVINIEPTELSGVTISNVAGYNAKYVFDNNIAIDSIIEITRSGDVIPKHLNTISFDRNQVEMLADELVECNSCGGVTKWDETYTELVCKNPDCKEMKIMKMVHFFGTMEIEEFGEPSVRRLYGEGYKCIDSILNITKEEFASIEGFGERSAEIVIKQFKNLLNVGVPFARVLAATDVMEGKLGEKTIQLILNNISERQALFLENILTSSLVQIDGVAEVTASAFMKGIKMFQLTSEFYSLPILSSYFAEPKAKITGDKYKGMKICFSGVRPSKEKEAEIISNGGEIVSGVSAKTTHLVVKDITSTSSKTQKAKELGIKVLSINQF